MKVINELIKGTQAEKDLLIKEKKQLLSKYKEDELFGMVRSDYEEKKKQCEKLVLELRELEK